MDSITYVCCYWRSAALGLYEHWSSFTSGLSISWSRTMIERSAPLPMRIDIRIGFCFHDGVDSFAISGLLFTITQARMHTPALPAPSLTFSMYSKTLATRRYSNRSASGGAPAEGPSLSRRHCLTE